VELPNPIKATEAPYQGYIPNDLYSTRITSIYRTEHALQPRCTVLLSIMALDDDNTPDTTGKHPHAPYVGRVITAHFDIYANNHVKLSEETRRLGSLVNAAGLPVIRGTTDELEGKWVKVRTVQAIDISDPSKLIVTPVEFLPHDFW